MASRWADKYPVIPVGNAWAPKAVTLVYPFYDNARFFARQCAEFWQACPIELRRYVKAIVVDDGSPRRVEIPLNTPFPLRLFRIEKDVPWNWLAARNIGAFEAAESWLLLTDMDHVIPAETFRSLVNGAHNPTCSYFFSRRDHTGKVIPPHSASFFLTRKRFWDVGGYDETLSGHYGTDGEFRRRLAPIAPIHVVPEELIRYESVDDASTIRYRRKLPEDATAVAALVKARGPHWTPKVLSFPYHEVSLEAPCSA